MKLTDLKLQFNAVGENVRMATTEDGKILLAIDPTAVLRSSASGKSETVATTGGNIPICGIKLGVNAYRPLDKDEIAKRDRAARAEAIAKKQAEQDQHASA